MNLGEGNPNSSGITCAGAGFAAGGAAQVAMPAVGLSEVRGASSFSGGFSWRFIGNFKPRNHEVSDG